MDKKDAFYISKRLLSEAVRTYSDITSGPSTVYISAAVEVLELFPKIADIILNYYDYQIQLNHEIEQLKTDVELSNLQVKAKLDEMKENYSDQLLCEECIKICKQELIADLRKIASLIQEYEVDQENEVADYQLKLMNRYNNLLAL